MPLKEITKNFKEAMVPFENLAIDESLVLWKGRLSFKQFIKTKPVLALKYLCCVMLKPTLYLTSLYILGVPLSIQKLTLALEFLVLL